MKFQKKKKRKNVWYYYYYCLFNVNAFVNLNISFKQFAFQYFDIYRLHSHNF